MKALSRIKLLSDGCYSLAVWNCYRNRWVHRKKFASYSDAERFEDAWHKVGCPSMDKTIWGI